MSKGTQCKKERTAYKYIWKCLLWSDRDVGLNLVSKKKRRTCNWTRRTHSLESACCSKLVSWLSATPVARNQPPSLTPVSCYCVCILPESAACMLKHCPLYKQSLDSGSKPPPLCPKGRGHFMCTHTHTLWPKARITSSYGCSFQNCADACLKYL